MKATAPATGQAFWPEQPADQRAAGRRQDLLHETEQRRRRAGAIGKRHQRTGDRLRQHHAETGEIDRDRQHQRPRRGQTERQRRRHAEAADGQQYSAKPNNAIESDPHHQPRRNRRTDHIADRAEREGDAEIKRRQP